MKLFRAPLLLLTSFTLLVSGFAADATGYWEGTISLPNRELDIRVELSGSVAAWKGTIDIPAQGLRGFALQPVKIDGTAVELGMPGIPGDPVFKGKLAADGKSIAGDFTQGPGTLPFQLQRKAKPAPTPRDETPARGVPGKGLAGNWRGSLKPIPAVDLRLALELASDTAGKLSGTLVSLDQDNARIPISALTEQVGKVHFETPSIDGSFDGKLSADGSEIAGDWTQRGQTTPLVFKRLPAAKPASP